MLVMYCNIGFGDPCWSCRKRKIGRRMPASENWQADFNAFSRSSHIIHQHTIPNIDFKTHQFSDSGSFQVKTSVSKPVMNEGTSGHDYISCAWRVCALNRNRNGVWNTSSTRLGIIFSIHADFSCFERQPFYSEFLKQAKPIILKGCFPWTTFNTIARDLVWSSNPLKKGRLF